MPDVEWVPAPVRDAGPTATHATAARRRRRSSTSGTKCAAGPDVRHRRDRDLRRQRAAARGPEAHRGRPRPPRARRRGLLLRGAACPGSASRTAGSPSSTSPTRPTSPSPARTADPGHAQRRDLQLPRAARRARGAPHLPHPGRHRGRSSTATRSAATTIVRRPRRDVRARDLGRRARRRLVLARDPFGKKPLYYWHDARRLVFALRDQGAARRGRARRASTSERLGEYLAFGYVPTPRDALRGHPQAAAGVDPRRGRGRRPRAARVLGPAFPPEGGALQVGLDEAAERVRELFTAAVRKRLMGDVPLGVLLSGGVDSSAVAAVIAAARARAAADLHHGLRGRRLLRRAPVGRAGGAPPRRRAPRVGGGARTRPS